MRQAPFTIIEVENVITAESAAASDYASSEASDERDADFREALNALESDCWDNIDYRGDGTIIAYPADYHQSMVTGDYSGTEVIIRARRPEWGERLMDVYDARRKSRNA